MKKIIVFTAVCLSIIVASCGGTKEQEPLVAPAGMQYIDISRTGMNMNVLIPDSTKGGLDTVLQTYGTYEIKRGAFQIAITEDGGDVTSKKADNANDDVNKVKQYVIDEPNTLLWESGIGDLSEFHFFYSVKFGERTFVFEDIKGDAFTKEDVQKMLDACKAAKEIVKEVKS
jgi:hypothetical protein